MKTLLSATIAVIVCPSFVAGAETLKYPRPNLLVEPAQLAAPQVSKQFVILDVRGEEQYKKEHVPGALWVSLDEWKTTFGDGKDAEGWGKRIGRLGIHAGSRVVAYDDSGTKDAARIWWILRYWGIDDVRLLNGGWNAWKTAGHRTTDGSAAPVKLARFKPRPRFQRLATMDQILAALRGKQWQIIDTRSKGEFCGTDLHGNKRGGAIPGAKHLEWSNLIDQDTKRFKTPAELRRLFDQAGIDLSRPAVSHCQSGGRASVMVFALELMGAKDARNYYRSWAEWGNAENTPIVVPKSEANDSKPR